MFPKKRDSFRKKSSILKEGFFFFCLFSFNDRFRCLAVNVSFPLFTHTFTHRQWRSAALQGGHLLSRSWNYSLMHSHRGMNRIERNLGFRIILMDG